MMNKRQSRLTQTLVFALAASLFTGCESSSDARDFSPKAGIFELQFDEPLSADFPDIRLEAYRHDLRGDQPEKVAIGSAQLHPGRVRVRYVDLDPTARRTFSTLSIIDGTNFAGEPQRIIGVRTFLGLPNNRYAFLARDFSATCATQTVQVELSNLPADPTFVDVVSSQQRQSLALEQDQTMAATPVDVCAGITTEQTPPTDRAIIATAIREARRSLSDFDRSRYGVALLETETTSPVFVALDRAFSERQVEVTSNEPIDFALVSTQSFLGNQNINLGDDTAQLALDVGFPLSIGESETAWDEPLLEHQLELFTFFVEGLNRNRSSATRVPALRAPVADPIQISLSAFPFQDLTFDPVFRRSYGWALARATPASVGLLSIRGTAPASANNGTPRTIVNWVVIFDPAAQTSLRLPAITEPLAALQAADELRITMQQYDFAADQSFDEFWLGRDIDTSVFNKTTQSNPTPISSPSGGFLSSYLRTLASDAYSEDFLPE